MRVILIRNYLPDQQESMRRFADMLEQGFCQSGIQVINIYPTVFFAKQAKTTISGLGKWLGYLDKWILFPLVLQFHLSPKYQNAPQTFFHICDHSNSPYLAHLPKAKTGITCHDVLAIRGAMGFEDAYCPASPFGKVLQKWILSHLRKANRLACVSHLTYQQLSELISPDCIKNKKWVVIHNAFNADFAPIPEENSDALLSAAGFDPGTPFLLHVGSSLLRKNRKLLVDVMYILGTQWTGNLCLAGEPIEEELLAYINGKGLTKRVISLVKPDHAVLTALYSRCEAFLFPSFSEGFGWPIIEAQACGAPVIASNIEPLPEVSGGAAIHKSPYHAEDFAAALMALQDDEVKLPLIGQGYQNVKRFSLPVIIRQYVHLYEPNFIVSHVS